MSNARNWTELTDGSHVVIDKRKNIKNNNVEEIIAEFKGQKYLVVDSWAYITVADYVLTCQEAQDYLSGED